MNLRVKLLIIHALEFLTFNLRNIYNMLNRSIQWASIKYRSIQVSDMYLIKYVPLSMYSHNIVHILTLNYLVHAQHASIK